MRSREHSIGALAIGVVSATVLAAALGGAGTAVAQVYPLRPITMIVPFPAGGAGDTVARTLAERMRISLGQSVIVENVIGASGSIGTGRVARAAPDGYTLGYGGMSTHVVNGAVLTLPYDVVRDFQPVALMTNAPLLIVARKAMPAAHLRELIAWLKANPDKASMGTGGLAATSHLAGVLFQKETGTRFGLVPYRSPAMTDLVAGQIDMMIDPQTSALPLARAGSIKVYAITARNRSDAAPDIPTVDEAGVPGLYVSNWTALFAPQGVPDAVIRKLNAAVVDALADPAVRKRLTDLGLERFSREQQTPEALATFHQAEIARWWPIIKAVNIGAK
jgi:tripartite-type tricarboxylate transporter receptor subunit TctC